MIINKIYHLADLHIRNLQRHKEYRLVFKKFLKQVKEDKIEDSIIYLAGDIAHAKTEMSPELVQEISWFLTECAKLRETVLITGNHDCNLNNSHRLDVLTPIIENLKNDRIHYLRDTGVYNLHNLTLVPYSIMDDKENWPKGKDVDGENKIVLFHGPVNKAQTDIGYTVSSNSFKVDMFDGYDMALLGDIHKRQTFGEGYEWVAYAGSMIQQNHGELLENHGYLLWDVPTRTFTEHHLHNDYGFLTVDVVDGEIPQWVYDEVGTKLPRYPRLRLRFTNTEPSDMKRKITELKKLFKVAEVTVTRTDTIGQLKTNQKVNKNIVGDVKDTTFQNSLIRDYLERQYLLEAEELDKIQDINSELNTQIDTSEIAGNILWTPKQFNFSNMFSYGEDNLIRFDNARGIMGIFAPNASGKSSMWDALSFCIYDRTSRTNVSKNVLNNRKDNFYCKFNFEIDGVDYFIERTAKWTRKKTNLKVDVSFWKEDGGVIESLNGEQRRETNKNIEKYLGKFEDFVLTALSLQGNNALFIDKSQSERKEILSQFIGVDIFDKLYQKASDENRDNATLIRKFKSDDFTQKLADIDTELKTDKNEYKLLEMSQKALKEEDDILNRQIIKLNADSGVSIEELEKRLNNLKLKKEGLETTKGSLQERITFREEQQITLDEILDKFDEEDLEEGISKLNQCKVKQTKLETEIDKINIKKDSLYERKEHLDSHKYNENCDICIENSQTILEQKDSVNSQIKEIESNLQEVEKEKLDLSIEIDSLKGYADEWDKYKDAKDKEDKLDREIYQLINKLSTTETEEIRLDTQVIQQAQLIDEYYKNEKQIQKNKEIRNQITDVRQKQSGVKDELKRINSDVLKLNGKISALQNQKETIEDRIQEVKDLEEQSKLFDFYLNALGKDGVSYELIEKSLPMIEGEVNNILAQIVEFGMQLEIDGRNINAYLVYGDQRWSLEMCSGMERFISGLAIRVALINVCNLPRPNFLVIDEGFGTLDSENLQSLFMLFTYLKTQFDFVMVISHIDSMRDVVDGLIEIKKVNGFSNVKF